jgi:hypothetical protein
MITFLFETWFVGALALSAFFFAACYLGTNPISPE